MFYKSVHLVCDTIQDVKIQWQNNQKARTEIHIYIEKVFLSFQPQDAVLVDREEQNADEGHSSSHGGINA